MLEELVAKILDTHSWYWEDVVKPARGESQEVTIGDLILCLIQYSGPQTAKHLGIGEQTVNRLIKKTLIPTYGPLNGGNETWKYVLLKSIGYKYCSICDQIKPHSKFGKDKHTSDGLFRKCRRCRSYDNATLYSERKLRIPSWFSKEREKIADFYDNCPDGYHVDHIIPLQGTLVSGLHTLNNLQYLPEKDNIKKSNSFNIMGDW